jgi:mannose-6-phosphate isomerase
MHGDHFCVLANVAGACEVVCDDTTERLLAGQSCLLPACLGAVQIVPVDGAAPALNAYVPDLGRSIVAPLRADGVADGAISRAGGPHATL